MEKKQRFNNTKGKKLTNNSFKKLNDIGLESLSI